RWPDGIDTQQLAYAYVLSLAGHRNDRLRVLDYGGHLGSHFWIAQALLRGTTFDFHCKELPAIADAGRLLNPSVTWHTDDTCFGEMYEVVMFSSSVQYLPDWRATLRSAATATAGHLLLSYVP